MDSKTIISTEQIQQYILFIRDQKVMLDAHLALLYGVETRALIQAVKRNIDRFPGDFMFKLTTDEFKNLRSQNVMSSLWGGRRHSPYVFTEQGIAMLSSVLKSKIAVKVNIEIMRVFVKLRHSINDNKMLYQEIKKLECKYDEQFKIVFDAIHQIINPPENKKKRRIGFV